MSTNTQTVAGENIQAANSNKPRGGSAAINTGAKSAAQKDIVKNKAKRAVLAINAEATANNKPRAKDSAEDTNNEGAKSATKETMKNKHTRTIAAIDAEPNPNGPGGNNGSLGSVSKPASPPIPLLCYNMRQAAQALGVSYVTISRLISRGLLKSSTALRHKRIPVSELQRFLKVTTE